MKRAAFGIGQQRPNPILFLFSHRIDYKDVVFFTWRVSDSYYYRSGKDDFYCVTPMRSRTESWSQRVNNFIRKLYWSIIFFLACDLGRDGSKSKYMRSSLEFSIVIMLDLDLREECLEIIIIGLHEICHDVTFVC